MEIKRIDWVYMFCFLFIIIATSFFILYYYIYHVNVCYADPLEYYVKKINTEYGGAFKVSGLAYLRGGDIVHTVYFGDYKQNMTTEILEHEVNQKNNLSYIISNFSLKN